MNIWHRAAEAAQVALANMLLYEELRRTSDARRSINDVDKGRSARLSPDVAFVGASRDVSGGSGVLV